MIDALPFAMLASLVLLLFSGLPVAVVLAGLGVMFCFIGVAVGEMPFVAMYNIPPKFISAMSSSLFYPAVAMLLFMGVALEKAGIADDMLHCFRLLLRRLPGGLVIAVLVIGVILAPAAGIVGASVVTLTLIALPSMLRNGYRASTATGAIAAAGTVGIILPPAVMLFFLAGQYQVPLGSMFMATVIPGAMLFCAYVVYYLFTARAATEDTRQTGAEPDNPWQWALLVLRGLIMPVALIALVLGSIIAGWATPSQSGAIGAAGGLLLVVLNGKLNWTLVKDLVATTSHLCAMVFFIIMAAAVFSYPFRYFGGDSAIAEALQSLNMSSWSMLLLIVAIIFVLGFFIDWIEITVITLPVMYPVLVQLDFAGHLATGQTTMLWIAAITALVLQTSFITPPFGFALFFLKGSAPPGVTLLQIYRGIAPILVIQLAVIALIFAFPPLVTWLPEQIYGLLR